MMGCCGGGHHRDMRYGDHGPHRRQHTREYETRDPQADHAVSPIPMELLRERLAKGEITVAEYHEIAQALSS